MKVSLLAACSLAALLLLSSLASAPAGAPIQEQEPKAASADLSQRVADLEARVAELERGRKEDQARLEGVLRYLEGQRKAARALDESLVRVRELGFTKGINYSSRELLLDAMHAQLKAFEAPLPKPRTRTSKSELGSR